MGKRGRKSKTHEEFVNEVYEKVGDSYTVLGKYECSTKKVKMRHNNESCNNHEWNVLPSNFLQGSRCPQCKINNRDYSEMARGNNGNGNGKKTQEQFVKEVYDLVGDEYTVIGNYEGSNKNVMIRHNSEHCNNREYSVQASSFLIGSRCRVCQSKKRAESRKKSQEEFEKEIYNLVGEEYTVLGEYKKWNEKLLFRHNSSKCNNHEYPASAKSFIHQKRRCPVCNESSKGELFIKKWLDDNSVEHEKQYRIDECRDKNPLPFDFALFDNEKLIMMIEFHGIQHYEPIEFWGGEKHLEGVKRRDKIKEQYCKRNNIPLIIIPYWEIDELDYILQMNTQHFFLKHAN